MIKLIKNNKMINVFFGCVIFYPFHIELEKKSKCFFLKIEKTEHWYTKIKSKKQATFLKK